jgi:flavin-dependent thymidylate synthase
MSDRKTGKEITAWRDEAMFSAEPVGGSGPRAYLINATPDPLGSIAAVNGIYAGHVYRSRSSITDKQRRYEWGQVEATHLKAPLEFVQIHFLIEGVTRAFTHQMVRQRTAAYAQESMRFAVKEDMAAETDLPPTIRPGSDEERIWVETMETVGNAYNYLVNNGVPAEDARGLAPHAVRTRIHYVCSLKNLIDYSGDRLCTQAQFEWRLVWARMLEAMRSHTSHPSAAEAIRCDNWQWKLIAESNQFRPVCYKLGRCPWQGDIDRPCKIKERVGEGRWDEIDVREWLLDPNAAR